MTLQTVTMKGQITLNRDLLQHLGVKPGGKINVDMLPNGELRLTAARAGSIDGITGV